MARNTSTNVDFTEFKSRPLRNEQGSIIDDFELSQEAIAKIDAYTKGTGNPAPVTPKFVEWLRDGIEYVKSGKGTMTDYKKSSVLKQFDYGLVVENTNKINQKLEKNGVFAPHVMKKIKGVSR